MKVHSLMVGVLYCFIGAYRRFVSPFLGHNCRFIPSCSEYAQTAFIRHGLSRGCTLMVRRFFSCHPWSRRTWKDPVPAILTYKREESNESGK